MAESKVSDDDSREIKGGPGVESQKLAGYWKTQIELVEKANSQWYERGNNIVKRFKDERGSSTQGLRRMNILWANFKILKPALYSRRPVPNVDRTFADKDPTGKLSSQMLERGLRNEIEVNGYHKALSRAVNDYLLPGRGMVWVRYEPEFGEGVSLPANTVGSSEDELDRIEEDYGQASRENDEEAEKLEDTGEVLLTESAPVDYINWHDFYIFPADARTWDEVQAVGKRVAISRVESKRRFGEDIGTAIRSDTTPSSDRARAGAESDPYNTINERSLIIYEIWNKTDRRVYWLSKGYEYLCDVQDDPLKLRKFWPCPEPLSATLTNESLIPVPDYQEYQDQAIQIDELTQRLSMLTKACKIAGTYDASNGALRRIMSEAVENDLIPVDQWAMFAEKGGVKGGISLLPIDEIQKVIDTLIRVRQTAMQDLDLITGITDVSRGTTDSRETLGGIRIKNNTTGSRLSERQNEVATFATETLRIVAEVMAKHFTDDTLVACSGILYEDELQPATIMAQMAPPPMPQGQGAPPPQQPHPMTPGIPPQQPQQQQQQPPQMNPAMMQAQQGSNVVPMRPGMPPSGPQVPPMGQMPVMFDPHVIIEDRIKDAIQLLRDEIESGYRIDIETDSTVYGDQMQERQDATEFVSAVTQFLTSSMQISQGMPEAIPLFSKMLQFAVRKYRSGRDLEAAINDFCDKMEKKAKQLAENPPPNPEEQKAKAEQQKSQLEMQRMQYEQQIQQQNDARDAQREQQNRAAEIQKQQIESQKYQQERDMDMRLKVLEMQMKEAELRRQNEFAEAKHRRDMQMLDKKAEIDDKKVINEHRKLAAKAQ